MVNRSVGSISASLLLIFVLMLIGLYFVYSRISDPGTTQTQVITEAKQNGVFTFTAAGDFGNTTEASSVLEGISTVKSDFTLALGDLGYGGNGTEQKWCDLVKSRVGEKHPFELVAGNHDDGTKDGDISGYTKCLPNRIDNIVGDYGIEYYFDYMNTARFIMISPDIQNYGFDYANGSEHLQWVINAVNDARSNGIEWIVLGMHKNCITPGTKTCEIGEDLLNAAVNLKIDLVLQGHEHAYFRSKQLALNKDTCPAIVINEYDEACIAHDGNNLKKHQGTVIVISGAGGYKLRDVSLDDSEFDYFEAVNGKNTGGSHGFSLFSVSENEIKASFVPITGSFSDSFTIN